MNEFIQVLVQAQKSTSYLFIPRINLHQKKYYWCLYTHNSVRNARELRADYLVTNCTRSTHYSIHSYTNTYALAPCMNFHDAKLRLFKTTVEGKSSTISPNHTCQSSLLILSYNISPSHFSLHTKLSDGRKQGVYNW